MGDFLSSLNNVLIGSGQEVKKIDFFSIILEDTSKNNFKCVSVKKNFQLRFFHSSFEQQKQKKCLERGSDEAEADYSKPFLLFLLKCFMKKNFGGFSA